MRSQGGIRPLLAWHSQLSEQVLIDALFLAIPTKTFNLMRCLYISDPCPGEKVEAHLLEAADPACWSVGAGRGKRWDGAASAHRQLSTQSTGGTDGCENKKIGFNCQPWFNCERVQGRSTQLRGETWRSSSPINGEQSVSRRGGAGWEEWEAADQGTPLL